MAAKLAESRASLEPGIPAMRGNRGYFAGVDRVNGMHDVSLRESVADAEQMASFKPTLDFAGELTVVVTCVRRRILDFGALRSLKGS